MNQCRNRNPEDTSFQTLWRCWVKEAAWNASGLATNTLIFERTGRGPEFVWETSSEVLFLSQESDGQESEELDTFCYRFVTRIHDLYGDCIIEGHCDPEDYYTEIIRDTGSFIREAERMAG
jgi:hypothetical protein